jgi:hypothetical protein
MTGLRIWLLVALVIAGGAFMACKSSKKSTTPTATKSSSATQVSGTPSAGTTPSATSGASSLSDLVNNAGTKTIKASYSFSASGTTETFTLYNKPPNWRFDVTSSGETSTYISADGKDYICTAAGQTCTVSPIALTSALPFVGFFTSPQTLSGIVGSGANHSTKTVAGADADCYSASAQGQTGEVCFNHDGILVSLSSGGITMEATSVSGTVADSDLTPPYPVQ